MIHGETRIVLRNPISGNIIKDVKSENTFQGNVIAQSYRRLGSAKSGWLDEYRSAHLWKRSVGGILLFKNSLPAGSQYMPAGNSMTANGSYNVSNSGNPSEMGSWNSLESSATNGTLKQVYDWSTSQGNGTIASICLTSDVGGYIGYGNASGTSHSLIDIETGQDPQEANPLTEGASDSIVVVNNYQYRITYSTDNNTVTIKKSHIPITEGSVFDYFETSKTIDVSDLHYSFMFGGRHIRCMASDGKIYIRREVASQYSSYNWVSLGSLWIWEYDPETEEITEITVTNSSAYNIYAYTMSVAHGMLFVRDGEVRYEYIFKLSDSTYEGRIEISASDSDVSYDDEVALGSDFPNGLVLVKYAGDNVAKLGIYDTVTKTFYPTNGYLSFGDFYARVVPYYDTEMDTLCFYDSTYARIINSPFYLATINNLSSPVVKDSSLTMKVEYILSEA